MLELVLFGTFLADQALPEIEIQRQVAVCDTWCHSLCKNADKVFVRFTAVNDSPSFKKGFPTPVAMLHELSAVLAFPSFLDRVEFSRCQCPLRICAAED